MDQSTGHESMDIGFPASYILFSVDLASGGVIKKLANHRIEDIICPVMGENS
jgi:hypothetical protein